MHIKPKWIQATDMVGEFDITDYRLGFDEHGPLRHLNVHWDAIVHFCKTLDGAQDQAKQALARALSNASPEDPEGSFILEGELECATIADETLTKATIFIVLCSFKEFALKEVYRQLKDAQPLPPKGVFSHIKKTSTEMGFWPKDNKSSGQLLENVYECVRNNFAHGDWAALRKALPNLELHDEFLEVNGFLYEIRECMRSKGINL
jgi:hypothetical protein